MKNVILVYAITQLLTTAYGLAVIESVRPLVIDELHRQGYIRNRNSLYNFNYAFSNILKAFIPFYYFIKALNIISNHGNIDSEVREMINKKSFVSADDINEDELIEENEDNSIFQGEVVEFEKPEKYTARKNNFDLYNTYEEDINYHNVVENTDEEDINPFIVKNVTAEEKEEKKPKFIDAADIIEIDEEEKELKDETKEEVKEEKTEVSSKDIAKAICDLNIDELKLLKEKINALQNLKSSNIELKLEKDVA